MYQLDPEAEPPVPDDDPLYPYINNDIGYGLFEDIVDSYYLDSQIKANQCKTIVTLIIYRSLKYWIPAIY